MSVLCHLKYLWLQSNGALLVLSLCWLVLSDVLSCTRKCIYNMLIVVWVKIKYFNISNPHSVVTTVTNACAHPLISQYTIRLFGITHWGNWHISRRWTCPGWNPGSGRWIICMIGPACVLVWLNIWMCVILCVICICNKAFIFCFCKIIITQGQPFMINVGTRMAWCNQDNNN